MAPPAALEVSDPTDWASTSVRNVAPLDSALRCQVCKDFYNNAVITSCAHSFCSLCIRRCLAADGQCPACRSKEQEVKLRRNVALQEVVDAFVAARADILALARKEAQQEVDAREQSRGQKRKRVSEPAQEGSQRQTRRSTRHGGHTSCTPSSTQDGAADGPITIHDSQDDNSDDEYNPEPEDGLVPCPMCGKRMKEEQVFAHLDNCETEKIEQEKQKLRQTTTVAPQRKLEEPPPERLPALNYALYNDTKLKQRLRALGISNAGSRPLLIRRHTEWINLWNANCDSPRPVSRRELLAELDKWERSQGGLSQNGGVDNSAIMKKDFDGQAWAAKNKADFDSLIKQAREKRAKASEAAKEAETEKDEGSPLNDDARATTPISFPTIEGEERSTESATLNGLQQDSQDQAHRDRKSGLPGHFGSPNGDVRQVPMFELPHDPVRDADLGEGETR